MAKFKAGDHVTWNSEAGHVRGTITKIRQCDFQYMGRTRRASKEESQYEIASVETDHIAAHRESALMKI